jgi:hypothetical protein
MPRLARRLLASYDQHLLIFIIPEAEIRECRGCIDHLHPVRQDDLEEVRVPGRSGIDLPSG